MGERESGREETLLTVVSIASCNNHPPPLLHNIPAPCMYITSCRDHTPLLRNTPAPLHVHYTMQRPHPPIVQYSSPPCMYITSCRDHTPLLRNTPAPLHVHYIMQRPHPLLRNTRPPLHVHYTMHRPHPLLRNTQPHCMYITPCRDHTPYYAILHPVTHPYSHMLPWRT